MAPAEPSDVALVWIAVAAVPLCFVAWKAFLGPLLGFAQELYDAWYWRRQRRREQRAADVARLTPWKTPLLPKRKRRKR